MRRFIVVVAVAALLALGASPWRARPAPEPLPAGAARLPKATFAGGCYWCMEPAFDALTGVVHVRAGWAGEGDARREAVEVVFDPQRTSYETLLAAFWRNVDPFDGRGQFCDVGHEYTSAIYPHGAAQRALAEASRRDVEKARGRPVATEIVDSEEFSVAGDFDQNYYRQHPVRYRLFRLACGRDARLAALEHAR